MRGPSGLFASQATTPSSLDAVTTLETVSTPTFIFPEVSDSQILQLMPATLYSGMNWLRDHLDGFSLLALSGCIFVSVLYLVHIIAFFYSIYRLHHKVEPDPTLPGVSVIKPIVGTDKNLYQNLESFFTSQYHSFELLFCFHSEEDEAIEVVRSLIKKHPNIEAKILFEGEPVGMNPKVNNMMPAYRAARYPLVLISDSAIFMRPDGILDMATTMMSHEKMASVTQIPYCKDRQGFHAAFEQIFFGTSHARLYLVGNFLGVVCSSGMSSMMKKSALDECGGMEKFGEYLAEDYFFAKALTSRGCKAAISTHPALQNSASVTVLSFFNRIGRWIKLRIAMMPHLMVVEPLQDCVTSGLIMAFGLNYLGGYSVYKTFGLHLFYWIVMDFSLMTSMQNGKFNFTPFLFVFIWLFREFTSPFIFIKAVLAPTIVWRNNKFKLSWGGRIRTSKNSQKVPEAVSLSKGAV